MLSKSLVNKSLTLLAAIAVWSAYSMVALAATKTVTGEITVTGDVTVNGQRVVSGTTISSGSVITTGENSTAVVSLGKTGRIEVSGKSNLTLSFSETGITGILSCNDLGDCQPSATIAVFQVAGGAMDTGAPVFSVVKELEG